jgi:hypothetical protein
MKTGVENSDLHLYLDFIDDSSQSSMFNSAPCSFLKSDYRINAGKITINLAHFETKNN